MAGPRQSVELLVEREQRREDDALGVVAAALAQGDAASKAEAEAREHLDECREVLAASDAASRAELESGSRVQDIAVRAAYRARLDEEVSRASSTHLGARTALSRAEEATAMARRELAKVVARRAAFEQELARLRLVEERQAADRSEEEAADIAASRGKRR